MADLSTCPPLTRASVQAAHDLVRPHVHLTPVVTCKTLDAVASTPRTAEELRGTKWEEERGPEGDRARPVVRLWFKCENFQRVGAFKVRGAFHAIERLKMEEGWDLGKGVVTHSSGNHAQALALAAKESGIPAHIVMPDISNPKKVAATRGYGANVVFSGSTAPEREAVAAKVIAETGARLVPPYDHPDIMLGQGTMGLELQDQFAQMMDAKADGTPRRKLDAVIAPCGGGGMLSGVALSFEGTGTHVFAAEPSFDGGDDLCRGLQSGTRIPTVSTLTIADGLRTPVGLHPWTVIHDRRLVRAAFPVSERDIARALRLLLERAKLVVEPSAVVGLAAVLFNEDLRRIIEREGGEAGWNVGVVLSGGNISLDGLAEVLAHGD